MKLIICTILITLVITPAFASGSGGSSSGARGGGEATNLDGKPALRDLVDNTVCNWVPAKEFLPRLTHYPKIIRSLISANWVFSVELEDSGSELDICLVNGPLKKLSSEELNDVTVYSTATEQVAIRYGQNIYLNLPLFEKMDAINQAYLYLHEVMHSFVGKIIPQRMSKLRSMVAAIRQNELHPTTEERFYYLMLKNDISPAVKLDYYNEQKDGTLKILYGQGVEQEIAASQIACSPVSDIASHLTEKLVQAEQRLNEHLDRILRADDAQTLDNLVTKGLNTEYGKFYRYDCTPYIYTSEDKLHTNLESLLITAVKRDSVKIFQYLLERKLARTRETLNYTVFREDYSVLDLLAAAHLPKNLAYLLSRSDFDPNYSKIWGHSWLWQAIGNKNIDAVMLLLAHKKINVNDGYTPTYDSGFAPLLPLIKLHQAAEGEEKAKLMEAVKLLVAHSSFAGINVPIYVSGETKVTALMIAAVNGDEEVVKFLLDIPGIDAYAKDPENGKTALDYAEGAKNYEEIEKIFHAKTKCFLFFCS